ncbi:MAG TPA: HlyD family efflux transporter periplasmic adaptor subunit [Alphaproteobacteria bacterium]|nr:HlyD family efflux transporter periplasmic adaptor subunit [Alphaproteobacteria bacterium]
MAQPAAAPAADLVQRQLAGLTGLLQLEKRIRAAADAAEFGFVAVNETQTLLRYRQAVLWRAGGRGAVAAVSGLAAPDRHAPFVGYMRRLCAHLARDGAAGPRPVAAADLPEPLRDAWTEWLPAHGLWLPLSGPGGALGGLFLGRDQPWTEPEAHLSVYIADAYGHAWSALLGGRRRARRLFTPARIGGIALAAALAAGAFVPVRLSALAPAEVVARQPTVVRAPFEGVVDRFMVRPNEPVAAGQPLLGLDPVKLENRLDVARKALEVAEAELRQAQQQALFDPKAKAGLAVLQGKREAEAAEVAYVSALLERIVLKAPQPGIAIFDDPNEWVGRPVTVGERILVVADPLDTELEIQLPVGEAIDLAPGAPVDLFLNIDPQRPVAARVVFVGYGAAPQPDGVMAYRVKAAFAEGAGRNRIGLKGTAKLYGEPVPLGYLLLRRPLAALRQMLGV